MGGAWFIVGNLGLRRENRILVYIFAALSIFPPGYSIYLIIEALNVAEADDKTNLLIGILAFGGTYLIVIIITVSLLGYILWNDFGEGLKDRLKQGRLTTSSYHPRRGQGSRTSANSGNSIIATMSSGQIDTDGLNRSRSVSPEGRDSGLDVAEIHRSDNV